MTPRLTRRGRWIALSGALFVVAGAALVSPPMVSLGGAALASLMTAYAIFYPTAIALRRRRVEMRWWVAAGSGPAGAVLADAPFAVILALRNRSPRLLRVRSIEVIASSSVQVPACAGAR
jgi:hypothetical protein